MSAISSVGTSSYPPPQTAAGGAGGPPRGADKPHDGDGDDGAAKTGTQTASSGSNRVNVLA